MKNTLHLHFHLRQIPNEILIPVVLVMAFLGAYALRNSVFDMLITVIFGLLGYYMDRYGQKGPRIRGSKGSSEKRDKEVPDVLFWPGLLLSY